MLRHLMLRLAALACALLLSACEQSEAPPPEARPVMVVQPQPAGATLDSYPGEVRARHEPELAFRIAGKVVERLVETGERVRQDQPLARLDPADARLQREASRAQVEAAEANLRVARAEHQRYQTLMTRQLVSQSQFDAAENAWRAAEARVRQARAEFDVADNQLGYAVLHASRDGVIVQRRVEVGQVVAAGQTAFVLAADGEREIAISLPEQSLARHALGQAVVVELWSQPGQRYPGHIRELAPAADAQSRTYAVRVALDDQSAPAELGQSALVSIVGAAQAALALPLAAVSAEQGQAYVWRVRADATLERVAVRTGAYGEQRVPILDGLQADDWIVAAGTQLLHEGQPVRPRDRDNRPIVMSPGE